MSASIALPRRRSSFAGQLGHHTLVLLGAAVMTLALFLILPLIQAITAPSKADLELRAAEAVTLPPPPDPVIEEELDEPDPEDEPPPPELVEDTAPLDLTQLELALDPTLGSGWMSGDFALDLQALASSQQDIEDQFDFADLDQEPRAIYQPMPILNERIRKKGGGTVVLRFVVNERGRVETPSVESSDDPVLERPALDAVKQWKFEPGKHNGEPVSRRLRVPITFPKS